LLDNTAVRAVAALVDAASAPGTIRFFGGQQPSNANGAAPAEILGQVNFKRPGFGLTSGGATLAHLDRGFATGSGQVTWARIADGDGNTIFDCDVGGRDSGAVVTLNTTRLVKGGTVSIEEFRMSMGQKFR
jgi:hypothetical protein